MKRLRVFTVLMLCIALLAFAGCGKNDRSDRNIDNGTVTEETMNNTNNNGTNNNGTDNTNRTNKNGSAADNIRNDARDAVDNVENALDGTGTDKTRNSKTR